MATDIATYAGEQLTCAWQWKTILISIGVSFSGSVSAILFNELRGRSDPPISKPLSAFLLFTSGISLSIRGIFFMHFIGMSSCNLSVPSTGKSVPMFLESGRTAFSACVCAVVVLWAFYYASHDEHWNDIVEERMILAERIYARRERLANPELYKRKEASPRPSIWKGWSGTREGSVSAGNSKKSKRLGNIIERISVEEKVDEEKVAMSSGEVHKSMQSFAKGSGDAVVEIPHRERHESNTPLIAKSSPIPSREDKFGGSRASSLSMTSVTAPTTRLTPEKTVNSGKTANAAAYIDTADMKSVMKGLRQSVTARSGNNTFLHERKLELKIMILFDRPLRIVLSGVAIAISVLAMHHIGISSIQMEATYEFNAPLVLLSAIVALVASITGMFIIFRVLPYYPYDILKVIAAFLISFAVNGMHYCGMGALTYKYAPNPTFNPSGLIDGSLLADNVMYIEILLKIVSETVIRNEMANVIRKLKAQVRAFTSAGNSLANSSKQNNGNSQGAMSNISQMSVKTRPSIVQKLVLRDIASSASAEFEQS